jgi:Membrane transport protein
MHTQLAGISSFIFQLPFQLFFLECHLLEVELVRSRRQELDEAQTNGDEEAAKEVPGSEEIDLDADTISVGELDGSQDADKRATLAAKDMEGSRNEAQGAASEDDDAASSRLLLWLQLSGETRRDVGKHVLWGMATNPVIWGIVGGFVLSLSTVGPRFLKPTSVDYIPGLGWVNETLAWFGNMVSPLSLFAMGVWMQNEGRNLFRTPLHSAVLSMVSKLFLVPLLMVGLAKAMDLSDNSGRAAVLIASLPISLAAFSLGSHYKIGEALLSENIALGTALMLPTVLLWNLAMDSVELFPTTPIPSASGT